MIGHCLQNRKENEKKEADFSLFFFRFFITFSDFFTLPTVRIVIRS